MSSRDHHVFSVEKARHLIRPLRYLFHNPKSILKSYVKYGMTVVELGCGPGFFTPAAARLVGETGKVIAVDIQQGMLDLLKERLLGSGLEKRVVLHKCGENSLGIAEKADLLFAFHVVHELPDHDSFFKEARRILKTGGILFISEPKHHVGEKDFSDMIDIAGKYGFVAAKSPRILFDRSIVLRKQA